MSQRIKPLHAYNFPGFFELNRRKADAMTTLTFGNRAVLVLGKKENHWLSPFSAPFGGPDMSGYPAPELLDEIADTLADLPEGITLTLPPYFYSPYIAPLVIRLLNDRRFSVTAETNYHFDIRDLENYRGLIPDSARKLLAQAERAGLRTVRIADDDTATQLTAYRILDENRRAKGRCLSMTFDELQQTAKVIHTDWFITFHGDTPVAAAVCHNAGQWIDRVIYWGHLPEHSGLRPVNKLAFDIFSYYDMTGSRIIDVGPASVDGTPDPGLCRFKESIGCRPAPLYRFTSIHEARWPSHDAPTIK